MKLYISGKMTGLPDFGRKTFSDAAQRITSDGHIVLNPGILPLGLDKSDYMPICLAMLDAADAIYLLNGWDDSPGAILEKRYAEYQGKQVLFESTFDKEA